MFETTRQPLNYALPPEVYRILSQAIQDQNNQYQGLGQSFGQLASGGVQGAVQHFQDQKRKKELQDALAPLMSDPNLAKFAPLLQARPDLAGQILPSAIRGETASQKPGKELTTIYRGPNGELSDQPQPGWSSYKVSQEQALQKLASQTSSDKRTKALEGLVGVRERAIDTRQLNELVKRTGLAPHQQAVLQQNNMRSDRAIDILSKPNITWQELALGEVDLAGIMHGGVPQVNELHDTKFPGWQESVARWKTYATGHPTENVPPGIRQKVLNMIQGVKQVDNKFLNANAEFLKKTVGQTVPNAKKMFFPAVDTMTNVLTNSNQGTPSPTNDPLGIRSFPPNDPLGIR